MEKFESLNVFNEPLIPCSTEPMTGFFRDGCCNSGPDDHGSHTVCVRVTDDFLEYSRSVGNDLSTPRPEFAFPGLKEGDGWCLCAARWLQAHEAGRAPRVFMERTHRAALEVVPFDLLAANALDLN